MNEIIPLWLIHAVSIIGLGIGTVTDLKKREVPDYLNFSLIAIGVSFGIIASVFANSIWPVLSSLGGLLVGYLIGAAMFYTGQWGGGDAKMLMGLGALQGAGLPSLFSGSIPLFASTIISILVAGAVYGLLYAIYLVLKHRKKFKEEFARHNNEKKQVRRRIITIAIVVIIVATSFLMPTRLMQTTVLLIGFIIFLGSYSLVVSRTIEQVCMIKRLHTTQLSEGDWIVKDIVVNDKRICGPKDLGISKEQIQELKRHSVRTVLVKEGIPFIPGFLLGYLTIIVLGNWLYSLIALL